MSVTFDLPMLYSQCQRKDGLRSNEELEKAKARLLCHLREEIADERVLQAMESVARHLFVPPGQLHMAYDDMPLPIGEGQTISQPTIVAIMTSALALKENDRVLELGTGSGYQAAILSRLVPNGRVLTVERVPKLCQRAQSLLQALRYDNIDVRLAGKTLGAPEDAPFDAILVTAAAPRIPDSLLKQLAPRGRMAIPVGTMLEQDLLRVTKQDGDYTVDNLGGCRFVPLIGDEAWSQ